VRVAVQLEKRALVRQLIHANCQEAVAVDAAQKKAESKLAPQPFSLTVSCTPTS